jgi:hypothetical protein
MVSKDSGRGMEWRNDDKVMSVSVDTTRAFQAGTLRELFRILAGSGVMVTADFKHFVAGACGANNPQSFAVMLKRSIHRGIVVA